MTADMDLSQLAEVANTDIKKFGFTSLKTKQEEITVNLLGDDDVFAFSRVCVTYVYQLPVLHMFTS